LASAPTSALYGNINLHPFNVMGKPEHAGRRKAMVREKPRPCDLSRDYASPRASRVPGTTPLTASAAEFFGIPHEGRPMRARQLPLSGSPYLRVGCPTHCNRVYLPYVRGALNGPIRAARCSGSPSAVIVSIS